MSVLREVRIAKKNHWKNDASSMHYWEDEAGMKQGECKTFFHTGELSVQCFYVDGVRDGVHKCWFKNGELYEHNFYVGGYLTGEYKRWFNNELLEHCFYIRDSEAYSLRKYAIDRTYYEQCFIESIFGEYCCGVI